jgi:hypothetical protein
MYVGINEPWKNRRIADVMDFVTGSRQLIEGNDCLDALFFHEDGARTDPFESNHSTGQEGLQTQDVGSSEFALADLHAKALRFPIRSQTGKAFYEILSRSIYSLLSEAAAKKSMSTD